MGTRKFLIAAFLVLTVMLTGCLPKPTPTTYDYDLSPIDWCYTGGDAGSGVVRFFGIVQNVGVKPFCGEGNVDIGVIAQGQTYQTGHPRFTYANPNDPNCTLGLKPGEKFWTDAHLDLPWAPENNYSRLSITINSDKDQNHKNDGPDIILGGPNGLTGDKLPPDKICTFGHP